MFTLKIFVPCLLIGPKKSKRQSKEKDKSSPPKASKGKFSFVFRIIIYTDILEVLIDHCCFEYIDPCTYYILLSKDKKDVNGLTVFKYSEIHTVVLNNFFSKYCRMKVLDI